MAKGEVSVQHRLAYFPLVKGCMFLVGVLVLLLGCYMLLPHSQFFAKCDFPSPINNGSSPSRINTDLVLDWIIWLATFWDCEECRRICQVNAWCPVSTSRLCSRLTFLIIFYIGYSTLYSSTVHYAWPC